MRQHCAGLARGYIAMCKHEIHDTNIRCRVGTVGTPNIDFAVLLFLDLPRVFFQIMFAGTYVENKKKIVLLRRNHLQEKTNIQSTAHSPQQLLRP